MIMQLCKVRCPDGSIDVGLWRQDHVVVFERDSLPAPGTLAALLHSPNTTALIPKLTTRETLPADQVKLLAPVDDQEVWAAGVTYKRSKVAREEESASTGGSRFYDLVYTAPRPELFFKAPAKRVVHPGEAVRIRKDAQWSVPEPELALVVGSDLQIVGYTIGNDMSSRDIEGENPLYLPQAKFYDGSCAVGPVITLASALPPPEQVKIRLTITRQGQVAFEGATSLSEMKRSLEELVSWLGKETSFPDGVVLLTGTGVVPPDDFTLAVGDEVAIEIVGVGRLVNMVG
jgi:2-dehydro-3-deoxy-D-arabinonate dehydratase